MRKWLMLACIFTTNVAVAQSPAPLVQDSPQIDTVTVNASPLEGVWKISLPQYGAVIFPATFKWGSMQDAYCRIEKTGSDLTANCFPNPGADGTVTVEKNHFHIAWGTMMAREAVDGTMQSDMKFSANYIIKLSGIAIEDSEISNGMKLNLSDPSIDKGGKPDLLKHLIEEMSKGVPTENFDTTDKRFVQIPKSETLQALGTVESVIYLGTNQKPKDMKPPYTFIDFFSVYDVEFSKGHRICGLHQREDGVLDGFRCI